MGPRLAVACALLGALALVPSVAQAEYEICPEGSGAGECIEPRGAATDFETARLYVTDRGNNRISVFDGDSGEFLFAFGWGVDTGAEELETCTAESGCRTGIAGSGAGQFSKPTSIAVDNAEGSPSRHAVYVGTDSFRVQKFDADGAFVLAFGWGVDTGAEEPETCTVETGCRSGINARTTGLEGKPLGECQIGRNSVDPIAVGPGGNVFIGDNEENEFEKEPFTARVEKFSPDGACLDETVLGEGRRVEVRELAIDAEENAYVVGVADNALRMYDLGAPETLLCELESDVGSDALALDDAGHLLASQREPKATGGGDWRVIAEYGTAGCPPIERVRRFGYGQIQGFVSGLAVHHSAAGDAFASLGKFGGNVVSYLSIPDPGPIVVPPSVQADPVGNTKATVKAEVNPEGKETEVRVEYLTQEEYDEQGGSFAGPATKEGEAVTLPAGGSEEAFRVRAVQVLAGCATATKELIEEGRCLVPETDYRYRVLATNEDNLSGEGEGTVEGSFTTKEPVEVLDAWSTAVGTETATLHAEANPLGIPTTGHFEYLTEAEYQANLKAEADPFEGAGRVPAEPAELDFGASEEASEASAALGSLEPGTAYRYRVVVSNFFLAEAGERVEGPVRALSAFSPARPDAECPNQTLRGSSSALLPDCRAYEMVSPPDKEGGDIVALKQVLTNRPAVLSQSAASGERLAYGSYRSFGAAASAPWTSQYIAERNPLGNPEEGWRTHPISPSRGRSISGEAATELNFEFQAFSEDLCQGWIVPLSEPTRTADAIPGFYNLYRRTDESCGGPAWAAATTAAPVNREAGASYKLEPQGLSADGGVVAFTANDSLEGSGAPGGEARKLYLKAVGAEGPPTYACVGPDGAPYAGTCSAGTGTGSLSFGLTRSANVTNALSEGGDAIYWTAAQSDTQQEGPLFRRANPLEPESTRVDGAAAGSGDLVGAASGIGNLAKFSKTVGRVVMANGRFGAGQPISGEAIAVGTTIEEVEETDPGIFKLRLSKAATATATESGIEGPASPIVRNAVATSGAYRAGQEISSPSGAIAPATTIEAVEETEPGVFRLTLSADATATEAGAALSATSPCEEADTRACTVAISAEAEAAAGSEKSRFLTAAADGSRAIFSTGGGLYEYVAEGERTNPIAGGQLGVLGTSADARRLYFASREALTGAAENANGETALGGEPNLYLREAGEGGAGVRFIGVLDESDLKPGTSGGGSAATATVPIDHNGRVSPDGSHAAFMSRARLTGYDNTDARSGESDSEVFLYDAEAEGGSGRLICASCNPSGARPVGANLGSETNPFWAAASLPALQTTLYGSRVLSEEGDRLFFESADPLVARDGNGRIDVYQWEAAGTGGCDGADAGFSARSGGCVELISSGQSRADSNFLDAGSDGEDAFFTTVAGLVGSDTGLLDVYDARAGGGFPAPPPPPSECEGEACQSAPGAPEDPGLASAAFRGAGNLEEGAVASGSCARAARKAKARSRAAKRARRAAARAAAKRPRRARAMRRRARRLAAGARKLSRNAKRCRARARVSRRAGR